VNPRSYDEEDVEGEPVHLYKPKSTHEQSALTFDMFASADTWDPTFSESTDGCSA